jgi:hypothetical protein
MDAAAVGWDNVKEGRGEAKRQGGEKEERDVQTQVLLNAASALT